MKAYISISYNNKKDLEGELIAIKAALVKCHVEPFVFIDQYNFTGADERQMMQRAMSDIESCDMLIAETSFKAIGVGIEAGYAKAKGKPVIYIRKKTAEHSTTVSGISDFQVLYDDAGDLQIQLENIVKSILHKTSTS
jgi:2'-deoxynucleoside 5'-phosphate N-hydrolase